MLRIQEKNSIVIGIFLIGRWWLGLDRFNEGDKKDGFLSIVGWSIAFISFFFLKS